MSSTQPRDSEGLPVFQTGMSRASVGKRHPAREATKRLPRKPPVPTAAEAAAAAQVAPGALRTKGAGDGRGLGREWLSPTRSARGPKSPKERSVGRGGEEQRRPTGGRVAGGDVDDSGEGGSRGSDRKDLLRMLKQAMDEIGALRRNLAAAYQECAIWKQRHGDLVVTASELEDRCGKLEESQRESAEKAEAETGRANAAESRFARLLAWAREEEGRRLQAEEGLRRACEAGQALEARNKTLEEEASESKRQLELHRFKLEGALEDLRTRVSENERLQARAATVTGQVLALRELADSRTLEVKDLREQTTRLVAEAKGMSLENVNIRKQLSVEREHWRAAERSRAKQDERRRLEMEQKCDDIHALRYRVQELEARVSNEAAMRRGAEEDARRSQEMQRRSMEELLDGRQAAMPVRTGAWLAHYFPPPKLSDPAPGSGGPAPASEDAWKQYRGNLHYAGGGDGGGGGGGGGDVGMPRDTNTPAMTSGARSRTSAAPDVSLPGARVGHDINDYHSAWGSNWRWRDPTAATIVTRRQEHPPFGAPPPGVQPPSPPPLTATSLLASMRQRGERRSDPAAAAAPAPAAPGEPDSLLRPRHSSPPRPSSLGVDNGHHNSGRRARPQPRRTPSEEDPQRDRDRRGEADSDDNRSTELVNDCGPEWWAGGKGSAERDLDGDIRESSSVNESAIEEGEPLNVVSL